MNEIVPHTSSLTHREVLPTSVLPRHYGLLFTPDIDNSTFDGFANIKITFKETTDKIVLNSKEIDVYNVSLKISNEKTVYLQANDVFYDIKLTRAIITLPKKISSGSEGELNLGFRGKINEQMNGIYKSSFKDDDGKLNYLVTTQLEATDARKAFPCWDEPNIKATFDISLKVPKALTALSNANVKEEEEIDRLTKLVKFDRTPKMSTYLLAFVVGNLDYIEKFSSNKVRCRVYAPRGLSKQGQFALDTATKVLDLYDKTFNIPYPLDKLDLVAIPDFDRGAMENWGLITYRITQLLLDESGSMKNKQSIANTVAHEVAHQWFGNLVTMDWWSDLWLNEGFATWVAIYAVDKIYPDWDFWIQFIALDFQKVLNLDSVRFSHPVELDIKKAEEVSYLFDDVSYNKGCAVLHMLYNYLGEETFFEGIRNYIKKHKYGNAKTIDLWNTFGSVSKQNISKFMTLWTKQTGYPYLDVKRNGKKLHIEQKRFLIAGDIKNEESQNLWWVPLGISKDPSKNIILTKRSMEIDGPGNIYKLNNNNLGFYRVKYPEEDLKKLITNIYDNNLFTTRDRLDLISDTAALSKSGITCVTDILDILKNMKNETNYYVLNLISSQLTDIQSAWFEEPRTTINGMRKILRQIFSPIVRRLGWEFKPNETVSDNLLRILAINNAGSNGDSEVIKEARSRFFSYVKGDNSSIHPDLLTPIFKIVSLYGDSSTYNLMKNEYLKTKSSGMKRSYLYALGYANSNSTITSSLNLSTSNQVRPQDIYYILLGLGENPLSRDLTWKFLRYNWDLIEKKYLPMIGPILEMTAAKFSSKKDYYAVDNFFKFRDITQYKNEVSKTLNSIKLNYAWVSRSRTPILKWVKARV